MGARSRAKGKRGERQVVRLARSHGLQAERTWHTAQSPDEGERACDVLIAGRAYQVKRQRGGFRALYEGLRSDGCERLAALPAEEYLHLLASLRTRAMMLGKEVHLEQEVKRG